MKADAKEQRQDAERFALLEKLAAFVADLCDEADPSASVRFGISECFTVLGLDRLGPRPTLDRIENGSAFIYPGGAR